MSEKIKINTPAPKNARRNLQIAEDLFNLAYKVKTHQLKKKYPEWSEQHVHEAVMVLIEKGTA